MLDTTTQTRKAQRTTLTAQEPQAEQMVVDQIMQPFMGNQDWAQLIANRTEQAEPAQDDRLAAGQVAVGADECWLPGGGYETMAFLSGLD